MDTDKDEATIRAAQLRIDKKRAREQKIHTAEETVAALLDQVPLRYVRKQDRYLYPLLSGGYEFIKKTALAESNPFWCKEFAQALKSEMADRGLMYTTLTYSFHEQDSDVCNLMSKDGWIRPTSGKHHPAFDWLMQSLGGGKAANIEHIERVITYKYLHPECFTLPALVIHGEGGVGKNLLVQRVLYELFDGQSRALTAKHVVGNFNSMLEGMTCVLIDESVAAKTDAAAIKALIGNPTFTLNRKGVPEYSVDNTAMYLIGSNKRGGGGVFLDRSDADRRYSPLRCDEGLTLNYWIAAARGINQDEAKAWLESEGITLYSSEIEISKWLGSLITKYGDAAKPAALHGADYLTMMDRQKPLADNLFESIFTDPAFTHIEKRVAWEGYLVLCRGDNAHFTLGRNTFYIEMEEWLGAHMPEMVIDVITASQTPMPDASGKIRRKHTVVINTKTPGIDRIKLTDNRKLYLSGEGLSATWLGDI